MTKGVGSDVIQDAIRKFSQCVGMPTIVIASSWRPDTFVDLDVEAVRALVDVVDSLRFSSSGSLGTMDSSPVALVVVGEGGRPGFADGVIRGLRGLGLAYEAWVPHRAYGVHALIALSADRLHLHPFSCLGAFDAEKRFGRSDEVSFGWPIDTAKMAKACLELWLAQQSAIDPKHASVALSREALGDELGASPSLLSELGFAVEIALGEAERALWELYLVCEKALGLKAPPQPRYTSSELSDEVQFELAVGLTGAFISSSRYFIEYQLDSGSPDPDTGRYQGQWMWDEVRRGQGLE